MRKCVSMVAVATTAVGLAGCSSPERPREPAKAAQPLSPAPSPDARAAGQHAPVPPIAVAAHAAGAAAGAAGANQPAAATGVAPDGTPQAPDASLAVVADPGLIPGSVTGTGPGPDSSHDPSHDPAHAVAPNPGGPALAPSGTAPMSPPAAAGHAWGRHTPARGVMAPPPALPAPAPPPVRDHLPDHRAQAPNIGYDPQASAATQIMDALIASQLDGKAVLLDFGANWCAACRDLDKAMHTPQARAVLERSYHVVRIDLGTYDNMKLASQYDAYGTYGMPLLVVLAPDGTVRADSARNGQPPYDEAGLSAWLRQWAR